MGERLSLSLSRGVGRSGNSRRAAGLGTGESGESLRAGRCVRLGLPKRVCASCPGRVPPSRGRGSPAGRPLQKSAGTRTVAARVVNLARSLASGVRGRLTPVD
ncbi:unnamed protein product [Natator depressus]